MLQSIGLQRDTEPWKTTIASEILSWVKFREKKGGGILTEHKHKPYKVDKVFKIWSLHSSKYLQAYHVYIELFNTWTEEPGRLQSMGSLSQTWLSDFTFTFHFHALEKETATHSSVLAWRIPGTGVPGGLPCMGLHRVRHDWGDLAAAASLHGYSIWIGVSATSPLHDSALICHCL